MPLTFPNPLRIAPRAPIENEWGGTSSGEFGSSGNGTLLLPHAPSHVTPMSRESEMFLYIKEDKPQIITQA